MLINKVDIVPTRSNLRRSLEASWVYTETIPQVQEVVGQTVWGKISRSRTIRLCSRPKTRNKFKVLPNI